MPSSVLAEPCAAIERALGPLGVRWFLFGAQAAALRGVRRFTADLDITIDPGSQSVATIVAAFEREGLTLRVADVDEFVQETRVLPMRFGDLPVDVVLAGPGFEDRFFDRAERVEVDGASIFVARTEDLVVMKILAGRPKDIEDVVAMLVANRVADAEIRSDLAELERLLDQSDLLLAFEATRARAARARR